MSKAKPTVADLERQIAKLKDQICDLQATEDQEAVIKVLAAHKGKTVKYRVRYDNQVKVTFSAPNARDCSFHLGNISVDGSYEYDYVFSGKPKDIVAFFTSYDIKLKVDPRLRDETKDFIARLLVNTEMQRLING